MHTAAAALLDGAVGILTFSDARPQAPDMRTMLAKVSLQSGPEIPVRCERMHVRLVAALVEGTVLATWCDGRRGHRSAKPVAEGDHRRTLEDCPSTRMDAAAAARLLERAAAETRDPKGMRALITEAGLFTQTPTGV